MGDIKEIRLAFHLLLAGEVKNISLYGIFSLK
jgi:hypothetical protein